MKNKCFPLSVCILAILFLLGAIPCTANSAQDPVAEAQGICDGILAYHGATHVQDWIDGYLTQNAAVGTEWYAFSLAQFGEYDFLGYEAALLDYLEQNTVGSASSRLKYALCLAAIGSTDAYILTALNDSIGKQGLMSWVFGLHLINNGYACEQYTVAAVVAKLMELQCADGGWTITGQYGEVDSTAMVLQALAPCRDGNDAVQAAIDRALIFLSERQLDGGDYTSYGAANPESTGQVLAALGALGIDAATDTRFFKNGNGLLDGIVKYRLTDGGFCHVAGGAYNGTATVQSLCAAISYLRFSEGSGSVYLLDHADPAHAESPSLDSVDSSHDTEEETTNTSAENRGEGGYKLWVSLVLVGVGVVVCIVLFVLKKRHLKNFLAVLLLCAVAVVFVCVTDFRTADDYYNGEGQSKENVIGHVTMTIRCDTVAGRADHIPQDGIILDVTEFEIAEGDSVYTILTEAARKYKIQLENNGNAAYAYISGIAYLYEFDFGDLSGWVYTVNGERLSLGAGEYKLCDGDVIEWHYSTNLGEDLQ